MPRNPSYGPLRESNLTNMTGDRDEENFSQSDHSDKDGSGSHIETMNNSSEVKGRPSSK